MGWALYHQKYLYVLGFPQIFFLTNLEIFKKIYLVVMPEVIYTSKRKGHRYFYKLFQKIWRKKKLDKHVYSSVKKDKKNSTERSRIVSDCSTTLGSKQLKYGWSDGKPWTCMIWPFLNIYTIVDLYKTLTHTAEKNLPRGF